MTQNKNTPKTSSKLLLDNTDEIFILVASDLGIISYNKKFEDRYKSIIGHKPVKGVSLLEITAPQRMEKVKEVYSKVFQGHVIEDEIDFITPSGETLIMHSRYKPIEDSSGHIFAAFVTTVDVTGVRKIEKEIERREQLFRGLIEHSHDMKILVSENYDILYLSPSVMRTFGFKDALEFKENAKDIIHPDDLDKARKSFLWTLDHRNIPRDEKLRVKRKDGVYICIEGTFTNMLDTIGVHAIVINARDITRQTDNELKMKNYIHDIEINNALLEQIAFTQSHLVRAPLARIMGLITLLKTCTETDKSITLDHIITSAEELDKIIKSTINMADNIGHISTRPDTDSELSIF